MADYSIPFIMLLYNNFFVKKIYQISYHSLSKMKYYDMNMNSLGPFTDNKTSYYEKDRRASIQSHSTFKKISSSQQTHRKYSITMSIHFYIAFFSPTSNLFPN